MSGPSFSSGIEELADAANTSGVTSCESTFGSDNSFLDTADYDRHKSFICVGGPDEKVPVSLALLLIILFFLPNVITTTLIGRS